MRSGTRWNFKLAASYITQTLQTLKLLLPAIIPSWRFFDIIAPSPRIEYARLTHLGDEAQTWQEFRPRPANLSIPMILKRMFYNPHWNESLFLMSYAERLLAHPTRHSLDEIFKRLTTELSKDPDQPLGAPYLKFRLVVLFRQDNEIIKNIAYISETRHGFGAHIA